MACADAACTDAAGTTGITLECQVCGNSADRRNCCPGCGAMFYCGDKHMRRHARLGHDAEECGRMAQQLRRREFFDVQELQNLPFEFAHELTAGMDAGAVSMCGFLKARRLHGAALWRRQCGCAGDQPWGSLAPPLSGMTAAACSELLASQQLPGLNCDETATLVPELLCWEDYYTLRRLPLSSPTALLLEVPLTLYRAVRWALDGTAMPPQLTIHLLGPQKELDVWPIFAELATLLPGCCIQLALIGPDMPLDWDGRTVVLAEGAVTLRFLAGLYHDSCGELLAQGSMPDLIFAPNAGLAAYMSWVPTLRMLPEHVPCVFSDYAEEAALRGAALLQAVTGRALALPVSINPFRRPASSQGRDNALPSFSNGFSFGVRG